MSTVVRNCGIAKILSVVLDAPIVHRKAPFIRLDVGDKLMAPMMLRNIESGIDLTSLCLWKDYELFVIERVA